MKTINKIQEKHSQVLDQVWTEWESYHSKVYIQKVFEDFFKNFSVENKCEVLDIGCGHNSDNLAPFIEKINLTGVDMDATAMSQHPWLNEMYVAPCENLPVKSGKYDLVFGRYSFEHFQDKEKSISEVNRVLKEDGMCVFLTVNRHAIEFKLAKLFRPQIRAKIKNFLMRYPEVDTYDTNYDFNDETEIKKLLENYGFKVSVPIHLMSTTSGFLRNFTPLCYIGAYYSKFLHTYNLRFLMAQMTVTAYKKKP